MKWTHLLNKWVIGATLLLGALLMYMASQMPLNYWHHSKFSFGVDFVFNDFFPLIKIFGSFLSETDNTPITEHNYKVYNYISSTFLTIALWAVMAFAKEKGKSQGLLIVLILIISQLNFLWLGATALSLSISILGTTLLFVAYSKNQSQIIPFALLSFFGMFFLIGSSLLGWLSIPVFLLIYVQNKKKFITFLAAVVLATLVIYLADNLLWLNIKINLRNASENFSSFSGEKLTGAMLPALYGFKSFLVFTSTALILLSISAFALAKDKLKAAYSPWLGLVAFVFIATLFAPQLTGKGNFQLYFLLVPLLIVASYGVKLIVQKFGKKSYYGLLAVVLILSYKGLLGLFSLTPFQYLEPSAFFSSTADQIANENGEYLNIAGLNLLKSEVESANEGDTIATNFYHNYTFSKGTFIGVDYFKKDHKSYTKGVFTRLGFEPVLQKSASFPPQKPEARASYKNLSLAVTTTPKTAVKRAFQLIEGPNIGEAVVKFKTLKDTFPSNPEVWYGLAKSQFIFNLWDDALASALVGLGLQPKHIKLNTLVGEVYRKQNKNKKALEKWNESLDIWKAFGRAHWLIGEYYLREDSLDKAIGYFINAKFCQGPIVERATKSLQLIDSLENKPEFKKGLAKHFIARLNEFGDVNDTSVIRLRSIMKRIQFYVDLDSTNAELTAHLGIGYMMLQNYTKAAITFEKAVELNPNYPQMREYLVISRVNLGAEMFEKDSLEEAIFHFRYALDYSPNNESVRANLSVAYNEMATKAFELNKLDEAYAVLKAAIFYNQENAQSFVQMGRLQMAINQKDSAEIAFNQAFMLDPANEEALIELIDFYQSKKDDYKVKIYTDRLNKVRRRRLIK